ncbi:MAG: sugar phosphate isomerase/epimerase [Candidatus Thorarchaeota archaeon]|nr:sugar phosphate isomerase/epimerase [Candidatus Thorarchaeota archaeon]
MQVGTFARTNQQIEQAINNGADFVDLRMDSKHTINFEQARTLLTREGIPCTLHLPSSPEWKPVDVSREILPYIDLGRRMEAELVTIHTTLSSLFYTDEDIDQFLHGIRPACEAARNAGVTLAIENLGLLYTEMALLFDAQPCMMMALDIGHGQIMAMTNRTLSHIQFFYNRIAMVNVHDNFGQDMVQEIVELRKRGPLSREKVRALAHEYDLHLPMGEGRIDFIPIFSELKKRGYDGKFLMMAADPSLFPGEAKKFRDLWKHA